MTDSPSFSRKTGIAAIELLEADWRYQSRTTRELLKLGAEVAAVCNDGSLTDRFNHLIKLADTPGYRLEDGEFLVDVLVWRAVATLPVTEYGEPSYYREQQIFVRFLDLDGFRVERGVLTRTTPAELELPQAQDDVTRLLEAYSLTIVKGHLDQALASHTRGDWASANAQLRTFYEALFDEFAYELLPNGRSLPTSENRRAALAADGFIDPNLNEWSNDGKNFVNGLFKRLHPAGSHPGLSDEEDSTFRRHVVLITARLFLKRFDARKNP